MSTAAMTNLLSLGKGLYHRGRPVDQGGGISMAASDSLKASQVRDFQSDLVTVLEKWPANALVKDILVDVSYDTIVSKTNRMQLILKEPRIDMVHGIVGARYELDERGRPYHVLTYYSSRTAIQLAVANLDLVATFLEDNFGSKSLKKDKFSEIGEGLTPPHGLSKSRFQQLIHDCIHISSAAIPHFEKSVAEESLVTIFPTEMSAESLASALSFEEARRLVVDETTLLLSPTQLEDLSKKAPYLVTMAIKDSFNIDDNLDNDWAETAPFDIPIPGAEPTIGVIDTLFDQNSPLSPWVDYRPMLSDDIPAFPSDYEHGTRVTSLIVAGHMLNPELDDGCGWFQVRHFGVAQTIGNTVSGLLRDIRRIVRENPDIAVWNLSLGRVEEISPNVISPLAACLDELQNEREILFIVADTNDNTLSRRRRIGSPADSVNSLVVNTARLDGTPASYSRRGPVLSFFTKPDVCAIGGDTGEFVKVLDTYGVVSECGTSFAAPWIARKAAYLINIIHLPRDVAKALIIDSALSWDATALKRGITTEMGYGIVPQRIEKILQVGNDEIRFYLSGKATSYETYTRGIPVPLLKAEYPYVARAVLSYAPACDKRQGVDYTNTELSLSFGRQEDKENKEGKPRTTIRPIADKFASAPNEFVPFEEAVRKYKRKWDNVKIRAESFKRSRPKQKLSNAGFWGISVRKTERLDDNSGSNLSFGIVVTLKSLDGRNRIEDFIQQSIHLGWDVREINIEEKIRVNLESQQEITFE